jgi:hypothetical protein
VKLARLRRPKAACSLSYIEYRPHMREGREAGRGREGGEREEEKRRNTSRTSIQGTMW